MSLKVRLQLSVMMFLQFFIWGAWTVTMSTHLNELKFQGSDIGRAYSTTAWAAMISPFFVGMIADRFFATERILGVLHVIGGVLMLLASRVTTPGLFFWVLLAYALCYMPTLALTNSLSFHQMKDPGKEFPGIRVLGTIGWIVVGWVNGLLKIEATAIPMQIAAVSSFVMGVYCFSLPHTPPQGAGKKITVRDVLGLDALSLMKERSFLIFVLSSLFICIPLAFYYNFTNLFLNESKMANVAGKMTFGQMSEIFFMLVMPFFFVRLGVKKMLLIGMLCWATRYALFAFGDTSSLVWMYYLGILLHGVCYDFFFVTGQIYVDKKAPVAIRASAQGFIAFVTLGVGMVIGANTAGAVVQHYQIMEGAKVAGHLWRQAWLVPAIMAAVVLVLFGVLFRENNPAKAGERNG